MIGDIRKLLEALSFRSFTVHPADGRALRVATRDHNSITAFRAIVTHDDGSWDVLPGLLMAGIRVDSVPSSSAVIAPEP